MSRLLLCAALALASPAALAAQDEKQGKAKEKEGDTIEGKIRKVDPSAHLLHIDPKGKTTPSERILKVLDSTVFIFEDGDKGEKRVKGKEAYKDKRLAERAEVKVRIDAKDRLLEVRVAHRGKDKPK
jgi:hypothetical protein